MATYENRQELADKADYEGGIEEMLFGYGLSPSDVSAEDIELREAIAAVLLAEPALERLRNLLPEPESY